MLIESLRIGLKKAFVCFSYDENSVQGISIHSCEATIRQPSLFHVGIPTSYTVAVRAAMLKISM